ncbi:hypothetical protein IGJ53_003119 [Enterococcus sp. DIV1283b]
MVTRVLIEADVWIGSKAITLPGAEIGKRTVVACIIVPGKFYSDSVTLGGNPIKIIKSIKFEVRQ